MPPRHRAFGLLLASMVGGSCLCGREIDGLGDGGPDAGDDGGGPITSRLWIGGVGAIVTDGLSKSGAVPFDETCFHPPSAPPGSTGGVSAIDGAGDLWVQQAGDPNGTLYVWMPAQLAQSCASTPPSVTLSLAPFYSIAFDADGNLWGSRGDGDGGGGAILGYRSENLKSSGSPTPTWTLTGDCGDSLDSLCATYGLAFDADGYLWVGGNLSMQAFSASTRTGLNDGGLDGTGPLADFHITSLCEETCAFMNLAFDPTGALWVWTNAFSSGEYHFIAYSRAQLRNAQADDQPQPVRDLDFGFDGLPSNPFFSAALAFDPDGDLWVGGASDQDAGEPILFRIPRESLALDAGSGLTIPDLTIQVPGPNWPAIQGRPGLSLAFSPIPPGLPIQP